MYCIIWVKHQMIGIIVTNKLMTGRKFNMWVWSIKIKIQVYNYSITRVDS